MAPLGGESGVFGRCGGLGIQGDTTCHIRRPMTIVCRASHGQHFWKWAQKMGAPKRAPVVRSVFGRESGRLLPGCADYVANPLAGLFIHRASNTRFPGSPVRLDLLQDHTAQPGKNGRSNYRQQHGFRFFSHLAILVTPPPRGQSRRRSSLPKNPSRPDGGGPSHRIQGGALWPVEWACKLAERPSISGTA